MRYASFCVFARHGESAIVGTVNAVLIGEFYAFAVEA